MGGAGEQVDAVVMGSGAAGLSAALALRKRGIDVLLVEKTDWIGGTTAHSEGMVWIPGNHLAREMGLEDRTEDALAYIAATAGNYYRPDLALAFLEAAPVMLDELERSGVRFWLASASLDYFQDRPGAARGRRSLCPEPFDLARLGPLAKRIRPPLASTTAFGGMAIPSRAFGDFYAAQRSAGAFARVAGSALRHWADRAAGWTNGRIAPNGRALVAALLHAYLTAGGRVETGTAIADLKVADGRIVGCALRRGAATYDIAVRLGVILAGGGASGAHDELAASSVASSRPADSTVLAAPGATGDALALARPLGAAVRRLAHDAAWTPTSHVPGKGPFPHFVERAKPGFIAVDENGRRFVNEADPYQLFGAAMRDLPTATAWLIGDHRAVRRHGFGAAGPAPARLGPHERSGYVVSAPSLEALAARIGMNAETLRSTVETFNANAIRGVDPEFGKGESDHNRAYGDAGHGPNPCLAPLDRPPFHAVALSVGDIGTLSGLDTNGDGAVLDEHGTPIPGLFAAGNDMASAFGGAYPAGGVTIGPALTFGWRAAVALAGTIHEPRSSMACVAEAPAIVRSQTLAHNS